MAKPTSLEAWEKERKALLEFMTESSTKRYEWWNSSTPFSFEFVSEDVNATDEIVKPKRKKIKKKKKVIISKSRLDSID